MPAVRILSRVAFLCNLCFLIAFLMHYIPGLRNGIVPSTIIILGNIVSLVLNLVLIAAYATLAAARKFKDAFVPVWLWATNILFFVFQIILLVK